MVTQALTPTIRQHIFVTCIGTRCQYYMNQITLCWECLESLLSYGKVVRDSSDLPSVMSLTLWDLKKRSVVQQNLSLLTRVSGTVRMCLDWPIWHQIICQTWLWNCLAGDVGKSKPLLKGFFDKPQNKKKSALKPSSTKPTPTVKSKEASASLSREQRPSSQSEHRQNPSVIADVLEREPSTQNQAMDENPSSRKATLNASQALNVNSWPQSVDPAMEHQDSIAQVPKKISRFKQQRMGASRW